MIRMPFLTQMFGHMPDYKQPSDSVTIKVPVYQQPVRTTVEEFDGMPSKHEGLNLSK